MATMKSWLTFWARSRHALMFELSWFVMWFNQPSRYHTYKVDEQQKWLCLTLFYENESKHSIKNTVNTPRTIEKHITKTNIWHFMQFSKNWNTANGHFFVLAKVPYIHSYFNLYTMATSPQWEQPLKHLPTAKTTSQQWTNGVYKILLFNVQCHEN